jgi:hypothetical protein
MYQHNNRANFFARLLIGRNEIRPNVVNTLSVGAKHLQTFTPIHKS